MSKTEKEIEEQVSDVDNEQENTEPDTNVLLQMSAALLKIDRAIMDIQAGLLKNLIDRLEKYEDVEKDRELVSRLCRTFGKGDEDDADVATESDE